MDLRNQAGDWFALLSKLAPQASGAIRLRIDRTDIRALKNLGSTEPRHDPKGI
jgi:hypothetical protein